MTDNKADASKAVLNPECQLKIYYSGDTPEESGSSVFVTEELDKKHHPWLFKWYLRDGMCRQFADTMGLYHKLSRELSDIFDAVIVNNKQREAIGRVLDKILFEALGRDCANENEIIVDPFEFN